MNKTQEGYYLNYRDEVVVVFKNRDGQFEEEGSDGYVIFNGTTCLMWHQSQERYFVHTDPKQDLKQFIGSKLLH